MTPCFSYFFIVLCLIYIAVFSSAIYDPRLTTTKPPERRELILPWHSTEREFRVQTTSPSPKWYQSRNNITTKSDTKNWSPWRKASGSEIEQRTQIDIPEQVSEQISEEVSKQQRNFKFDKSEQQESLRFPFEYGDLTEIERNYGHFKDDQSKYENRIRPQNEIDFEHKSLRNDENKKTHAEFENEYLYEGVATDSMKPRKENLLLSRKSQHKVARYNSRLGVQCPDDNSTGQFIYPPDCKFFVNCWKGRALVQPCAPGTHFNPHTLECDFPHKVKCYEDESEYFRESDSESQINRESQKLQEPKCPPYLIGLLPHHGDCTKFIQCAYGATYIMNCGPGTVFNPAIGVCDWPHNVKGCEDIFKFDQKMPLTPPHLNSGHDNAKYIKVKKITCPTDFTGLLAHPETCKKFLQCANGVTYVMDCGPGTAFNPVTLVCDWPYNVPSCKTDKFNDKVHRTEDTTWIPFAGIRGTTSRSNPSYNHTSNSRSHPFQSEYNTTIYPTFRPTWRPFTTSSSSFWISKWTTPRTSYDRSEHTVNYHDGHGHAHRESRYQDFGQYHPEWKPSNGNLRQSSYHNHEFQDHSDGQWTKNPKIDQNPQRVYHSDHPEGSSHENRNQDYRYNHRHYPPGYHYHHHHHHYHNYGPTSNPPINPSWNSGSPTSTIDDRRYNPGYQGYTPNADNSHWYSDHYPDSDYGHHDSEQATPSKTDQEKRRFQPYFPFEGYNKDNSQFHNEHNETKLFADDDLSASQRTDHDLLPNRQDYNRTNPEFYRPNFNHTFPLAENWNQNKSRQDRLSPPWIGQKNITWNQLNGSSSFKPSTWHDQQKQDVQTEIQTHSWDQGMASQDDKLRQQFGNNIHQQSTINKETDAKMAQWASRTNVLLNSKNKVNLESTNATQYPRTNFYPNGIYTDVNGIKGHYITKEMENNQEHSKIHQSHNTENNYTPFTTTLQMTTTTEKISNKQFEWSRRGRDFESAKEKELQNSDLKSLNIIEPEINDYDVDVLDDKNVWKPRLVFENKTKTTTASSVIMRIGPKNTDLELFNIETAPFQEKEPPFPVYYVQPVHPLTHSKKSVRPTPISGQTIRLRGGSEPNNGYVEVQGILPGWGIVCDSRNSWTLKEAHILCRQLGYIRGAEMAWQGRNNGSGVPTWIAANTITCHGNETRFQSCKYKLKKKRKTLCNFNQCPYCQTVLGHWGQVCDDGFGMINADVICKELGFDLGALEVRPGGFYGNLDPPTRFMVDQLKCRGNETTLRECDFNGWGVHNCQPEEAVGIVCKTAEDTCKEDEWKCDNSLSCIPIPFICDEVVDCPDHSDESSEHCDAPFELRLANGSSPLQGRVEVRHHGVWGTMCDDDFTNATATVICRSLGYGGIAIAKKNGYFGPGQGPIWLDEVFCHGNESQLYRCDHNHWGRHNCDHNEDAGVICSSGDINDTEQPYWINSQEHSERNIDELLPSNCGQRAKDFDDDGDLIFQKVVHGSVAPKGTYPWQASIRVRGHSRSNHWCGAVIISPLHVLTAAHCLEGYNKATYFVRAGDYNTDINEGTEVEANIEDYYVHEEFRKGHRMNNDIALILLKGLGIPLGKDIMPICLPTENAEYSPGLNCTISGFGSIEMGKTVQSKNLRYGWVPLLDQSICRADYVYGEGAISDGMMCAGYLNEGIDTCDGDSGGPLACYHNGAFSLYGITSWGQHCGKANRPGVYVRVAYYRRWINKKIRESLAGDNSTNGIYTN
ncbi:PREDICTED: uncharacterized protein LOC105452012 [Wasmannia auropunctata]|uniref:uncharacterized protein LOC105452012 n=1 Tax=Wasmannia auropunctata TaxID=64793 RepID=UPI0005ED6F4C|nr:PREDICTED: uncharacterized protein LOC105452012 [Wasmannia auropunctata]